VLSEVEAIVEWHSALWSAIDSPEGRHVILGFNA
jgi:hypothetical protein